MSPCSAHRSNVPTSFVFDRTYRMNVRLVVSLVLEKGKTMAQVARDLDLTQSMLGRWVEQTRAHAGKSTRGTLTTEEKEELGRLRKENCELRLERES